MAMKPDTNELALREDLKALLFAREADVKPLCAQLDTALDNYVDQACHGDIQRRDQVAVYEAILALAARLVVLRAGATPVAEGADA